MRDGSRRDSKATPPNNLLSILVQVARSDKTSINSLQCCISTYYVLAYPHTEDLSFDSKYLLSLFLFT